MRRPQSIFRGLNRASPQANGLVFWMPFHEGIEALHDTNFVIVDGRTQKQQTVIDGRRCGKWDGSGDYISFTSSSTIIDDLPTRGFSAMMWANLLSDGQNNLGTLFDKDYSTSGSRGWSLLQRTAGGDVDSLQVSIPRTGLDVLYISNDNVLKYDGWHHIAFTFDNSAATTTRMFIDGTEIGMQSTQNGSGTMNSTAGALRVGNRTAGDRSIDGYLSDVRLYDSVLSRKEISEVVFDPYDMWANKRITVGFSQPAAAYLDEMSAAVHSTSYYPSHPKQAPDEVVGY